MGSIKDDDILEKYIALDRANFESALLTGHLSTQFLDEKGLLVLTGSALAFEAPINYAYGFGTSKMATHALALQMSERKEIPSDSAVITLLPQILDTPHNREMMKDDVDKHEW